MPNFNNCNIGIYAKDHSTVRIDHRTVIKDASNTGILVKNNTYLYHPGISGSTGSSFDIISCNRGIQVDSAHFDIENAKISNTRYGVVAVNGSVFNFAKSDINTTAYVSFTGQAYGMFVSDGTIGSIFNTSITGYAGGTASLTSGNVAVVKNAVLFVGATSQQLAVNNAALGSGLPGYTVVDTTLGNKVSNNSYVIYDAPPNAEP